jgi:hypothetical protein
VPERGEDATPPAGGAEAASAFKAFEAAGWSARAATYGAFMARATAHAAEALLAGVGAGDRLLDVGCGPGASPARTSLQAWSPRLARATRS